MICNRFTSDDQRITSAQHMLYVTSMSIHLFLSSCLTLCSSITNFAWLFYHGTPSFLFADQFIVPRHFGSKNQRRRAVDVISRSSHSETGPSTSCSENTSVLPVSAISTSNTFQILTTNCNQAKRYVFFHKHNRSWLRMEGAAPIPEANSR